MTARRKTRYELANGEIWEPNPISSQRWICLNCDDYAAIHGDATMASYARTIAAGERVRRQGGVRIRFDPPLGRSRARKAVYVAKSCPICGRATFNLANHKLLAHSPKGRARRRSGYLSHDCRKGIVSRPWPLSGSWAGRSSQSRRSSHSLLIGPLRPIEPC